MKLKADCYLRGKFIQKKSGKEILIDKAIKLEYNEDSEEYKSLCEQYMNIIGFTREIDKDKFDREMLKILAEQSKRNMKNSFEKIVRTFKEVWIANGQMGGFVEFGGYLINANDFSAVQLDEIKTNISKF